MSRPARLLLLCYEFPPFRGGIASLVAGLAHGAAEIGHDVHVLAPDYHAGPREQDAALPFRVHRFAGDFCSILSIDKLTRFARLCRRTIRALQPDLVHATDPQSHMAMTLLARLNMAGAPFAATVHGSELLRYAAETVPRLWMRGAFRRSRGTVAISRAVRDLLVTRSDADPDRIRVVPPGIGRPWLERPIAERHAARRNLGVSDDAFLLITVARRVPDKGHLLAIDSVGRLPEPLRTRAAYLIVGDGPRAYAHEIEERAHQAGVRVLLPGALDDGAAIEAVDAADLFVLLSRRTPTRLEGFGLAILEAAARGLPAVALETGGTGEAVRHGETGILLPETAGPDEIARAIEHLHAGSNPRDRLGSAARAFATRFTWREHADRVYSWLSG